MKRMSSIKMMQQVLLFFVVTNFLTGLALYWIRDGYELEKQLASIPALLLLYCYLDFLKKRNLRKAERNRELI